jgi:hypothetical protein
MKCPASDPKARLHPHKIHWMLMTQRMMKDCIMVERTFFLLTRPGAVMDITSAVERRIHAVSAKLIAGIGSSLASIRDEPFRQTVYQGRRRTMIFNSVACY